MRIWKNLAVVLLIIVLLSSITVQAANPHGDNPHAKDNPANLKANKSLKENAEKELEIAKESLEKAHDLLNELSGKNASTMIESDLIKDAEKELENAELKLETDPMKSLTISKHVQALTKLIVHNLENKLKEAEKPAKNMTKLSRLKKELETLRDKALKLLADLEQVAGEAGTEQIKEMLEDALSFIKEGSTSGNITSAAAKLEEAKNLISKSEDLLESIISNATKSAAATANKTAKEAEENLTKVEVSVNVSVSVGESEVNIEQTSMAKAPKSENVSITKTAVAASNNGTLITISKKIYSANRSVEASISVEKNQSVLGGMMRIENGNVSSMIIYENFSLEPLKVEENRLKLKVEAPSGSPGKLLIIKLDSSTFHADEIDEIKVYVNGSEAILASSVLDLVSEVYDEPAYVFVISSEGVSVLIYLPHFSRYTIDVIGILKQAVTTLETALSQLLTRDTLVIATMTATIILMTAALLYTRKKELIQ